jgi:hypothetical protein
MRRNTSIEHKEVVVICEESGPINMSYNVLITTPKANAGIKHVVLDVTIKSALTCTNCGKIGHAVETCHNRKKEVPIVLTTIIKSTKPIVGTKTQLVKSRKMHVCYPSIICSNVEHRSRKCPTKFEVQNMYNIKPISFSATTTFKPPKTDDMSINVVAIITTYNQQLEH